MAYGILGVMGLTPPEVEKVAIDVFAAKASMVVTNVPGPRQPLSVAGTPLRGVLVWAPMSGSVAMSVSILSYDGRVTVGLMSDAGLVPDPERIVHGVERELHRLHRLYLTAGGGAAIPRGAAPAQAPVGRPEGPEGQAHARAARSRSDRLRSSTSGSSTWASTRPESVAVVRVAPRSPTSSSACSLSARQVAVNRTIPSSWARSASRLSSAVATPRPCQSSITATATSAASPPCSERT